MSFDRRKNEPLKDLVKHVDALNEPSESMLKGSCDKGGSFVDPRSDIIVVKKNQIKLVADAERHINFTPQNEVTFLERTHKHLRVKSMHGSTNKLNIRSLSNLRRSEDVT